MADYLPLYKPGRTLPLTASAAIVGGQLVGVSGSGTVAPTTAGQASWVGVAAFDCASGERVSVHTSGVQRPVASGAITAGDQVVAAAAGQVSTLAPAGTATAADVQSARSVVGIALTSAANGAAVEVQFYR